MLSMTLATSLAARLGAVPMAAHQICMQVWLATSLLSDAMAVAAQVCQQLIYIVFSCYFLSSELPC